MKHRITLIILASISVFLILIGVMAQRYTTSITDDFEKTWKLHRITI